MILFVRLRNKILSDGIILTLYAIIAYIANLKRRRAYHSMLKKESIKERFSLIYTDNLWSSKESESGEGSEIKYTENLRNWLIGIISKYKIRSLIDAPCGDFNWMKLILQVVKIDYLGIDIVESVIAKNKLRYEAENIKFSVGNICDDKIPACDLLMVRDCLFHLSYNDIDSFLRNIAKVDYKYLLTTTHIVPDDFRNSNIVSGDFRLIDLFSYPFCFSNKSIVDQVNDYPAGYKIPRRMIMIAKKDVPVKLISKM